MDTDKIEILVRAIELGSLSKAADEFSYTPSAVSHILDTIEKEIGTRFIKRTYKGIEIKSGYEDIVDNLKQIVNIKKRTIQIASNMHMRKSSITIATYASFSKHILPRIIKGFSKKFPEISINIMVVEKMKKTYERGTSDIIIGEKFDDIHLCWKELMTDPYVAVFPESYKSPGTIIEKSKLYDMPFILMNDRRISNYLDQSKFSEIIHVKSHDDSSIIHMVKEELGITILPSLSTKNVENITCIALEPKLTRNLGLIYSEEDYLTKNEIKNFIDYVSSIVIQSEL